MDSAEQESKLITNQANSVLHDSAKKFTNIPKTVAIAQSNKRNQQEANDLNPVI